MLSFTFETECSNILMILGFHLILSSNRRCEHKLHVIFCRFSVTMYFDQLSSLFDLHIIFTKLKMVVSVSSTFNNIAVEHRFLSCLFGIKNFSQHFIPVVLVLIDALIRYWMLHFDNPVYSELKILRSLARLRQFGSLTYVLIPFEIFEKGYTK